MGGGEGGRRERERISIGERDKGQEREEGGSRERERGRKWKGEGKANRIRELEGSFVSRAGEREASVIRALGPGEVRDREEEEGDGGLFVFKAYQIQLSKNDDANGAISLIRDMSHWFFHQFRNR